ncbi:EAL domain-containing protein [Pseudoalteromonas sp. MMG024]|uniref:EAL domain-containing protein n=1 Tax=Pseudoalteromonas sp. MMG024 TaxID=2909980 RepID=UPI001F393189|nr:EAL domain-containing protein [Pseudoalteromonas sp. MMG024]MCF6455968.1 EAL domain-containing protein [Pseudoalteromonas sp. MMG024]
MPVVFAFLLFFPLFLFANTEFEQIFDDHTAVMLLIEPKSGKIIKANQAAADFYGYSSQALQSKTIQEINLFTAEQVAEERENAHRQKRNYFIFRHQTAAGDIKTVAVYSIPIEFDGATLLYSVIKDISTQRQYQSEIWQYQKNLEQMVDSQVAIIKIKNNKIHAIYIAGLVVLIALALFLTYLLRITRKAQKYSTKLSQIVEQSPSAIITTDLQGYIDYQNKHSESAFFAKLSSSKQSLFDELRNLTQRSDEFDNAISTNTPWVDRINLGQAHHWLHVHLYPLLNKQQKKDGYVLILNDISKQKQDEKQLRLTSTVFRTANEAVMICDKNYRIQAVNEAFTEITGYNSDEVLNRTPDILSSDLQTEPFYANMQHQLDENNQWQGEICNRRKNGELYYEWLSITALRDTNGEIDAFVALFSDITTRKKAENKIYQQANFDSLTGLANRNLFSDRFEQALNKAQRENSFLALLFIDLDGFKHVNDTLGHSQGDTLLQQTATRLTETLRKSDTISRLGGDEFAVLIASDNNQFKVDRVAHKIQSAIATPYQLDNAQGFVSASIGITTYPNDGQDVETLMRKADSAMYKAKAKGKNNFQFFTAEMDEKAQKRRTLESELRTAIDNQQFFIDYQPIFDAKHNVIYACEALVRWHHPTKGLVSPDHFIELAEEIGVIANIGEFVLEHACITAAKWQDEYENAPGISVNISTVQFQRDDFIATIKNAIEVSGLPSNKLILEITESLLIENDKKTIAQLTMLANLGVKIAIDDFGTGYSSLSYLKKFPVHKLKIDRSFIKDIEHNAESQALTKAIIAMSKSLKLEVIAEGVELNAQMHWLTASDCSLIQGYWFAKPVDALTIKELLTEHNS